MLRQQSSASIASASGRREVSDEDIAAYAKQLTGPRYGAPRIFATSAKLGASLQRSSHGLPSPDAREGAHALHVVHAASLRELLCCLVLQ